MKYLPNGFAQGVTAALFVAVVLGMAWTGDAQGQPRAVKVLKRPIAPNPPHMENTADEGDDSPAGEPATQPGASTMPASGPASKPVRHLTPASAPVVTKEQIAKAAKDLEAAQWQAREDATTTLWQAGKAAEPTLEQLLKHSDSEVVQRARGVLEKFKFGIYPDTPKEIVDLVTKYRAAPKEAQSENGDCKAGVVTELLELGEPAFKTILALAMSEDPDDRESIFTAVDELGTVQAPKHLLQGDEPAAVKAFEDGVACGNQTCMRHYAAYLLLRGEGLPKARPASTSGPAIVTSQPVSSQPATAPVAATTRPSITTQPFLSTDTRAIDAKIRSLGDKSDGPRAMFQAILYQVSGDMPKAIAAAKRSGYKPLLLDLYIKAGMWEEALPIVQERADKAEQDARKNADPESGEAADVDTSEIERLAILARLAGKDKLVQETLDKLEILSIGDDTKDEKARVLLLCDKPQKALDTASFTMSVNMLVAQRRYAEITKLVQKQDSEDGDNVWLKLTWARTLASLGQKKEAVEILEKMAQEEGRGNEVTVAACEMDLGFRDEAMRHAAKDLASNSDMNSAANLLRVFFSKRSDEAANWLHIVAQEHKQDTLLEQFKRACEIMNGGMPAKDLADLVAKAQNPGQNWPADRWRMMKANALFDAGRKEEALLALAANGLALGERMEIGHWLVSKGLFAAAAAFYDPGDDQGQSPSEAGEALFFRGYCLLMLAQEAEGKNLMRRGDLLMQTGTYVRQDLAEKLARWGAYGEARRQRMLAATLNEDGDDCFWNLLALAQNPGQATDFHARAVLAGRARLAAGTQADYFKCLELVKLVHMPLTQEALAKGDQDKALADADLSLEALQAEPDAVAELVLGLQKAGWKDLADKYYRQAWDFHEGVVKDYPEAGGHRNMLGWLAARCGRDLEAGEKYVREALKLEPTSPHLLDTLAELRFQQKDRKEAIELIKKCIAADGNGGQPWPALSEYFQRQLKRFENGDPASSPDCPQ